MRKRTGIVLILAVVLTIPQLVMAEAFSLRYAPDVPPADAGMPQPFDLQSVSENPGELSAGRAVLYSFLIPGAGDWYAGNHGRAIVFFGVEAAIWTSFAVSKVQASQRQDSYEEYAVRFAGVTRTGHSDDYYGLIREYDNSTQYEAFIKDEGRFELYPYTSYDALNQYFEENRVGDYEPWAWQSLDHKVQYQEMRSASKNADNRATYALAAAAANRVVAAIFAYTSVRRSQKDASATTGYHLDFTPPHRDYDAAVSLTRRF